MKQFIRYLAAGIGFQLGLIMAFGSGFSVPGTAELVICCSAIYQPAVPVLVRLELRHPDGSIAREVWDAEATLSSTSPGVSLSPNRIALVNGMGSALVECAGSGDFELQAVVETAQSNRLIQDATDFPVITVSGVLSGTGTTWNGVVRVTGDLTVPEDHILTIESNTLVLIDGVSSGTSAPDLFINGSIQSLGTPEYPVTIACSDPRRNWGQIRHDNAQPSLYRHTHISKAGRALGEAHTGAAPALRPTDSAITFEQCVISDLTAGGAAIGKTMLARSGSDIVFKDCLLTRSRMGPEIFDTGLLCTNTWITHMFGPDDDDGIYLHTQRAGQQILLTDSVVAYTDDDGVDTLGPNVTVERCIVRNIYDKGTSVFGGQITVRQGLYVDCGIGISSKANNDQTVTTRVEQTTIYTQDRGIAAENKNGGAPTAIVNYWVTNCLIWAMRNPADSIYDDYGPDRMGIFYSNLGEAWAGPGNLNTDCRFVDAGAKNFRLQPYSPCIDSGDPAAPLDFDGSRVDMGCFPFVPPAPVLSHPERLMEDTFQVEMTAYTNRLYRIEVSTNLTSWEWVMTLTQTNEIQSWREQKLPNGAMRVYRARLGP